MTKGKTEAEQKGKTLQAKPGDKVCEISCHSFPPRPSTMIHLNHPHTTHGTKRDRLTA